ncbi:hypothetical protein Pst134EA_025796 [Puccinia striiformis f. sp. tritici]|uniref:hypothetical protein n=1 Tax=Puccinia striiformis f. sp. tritici TaxID=168172 RepID=UPI00200818FF|nr:hypothetical protein Pst134EA_025796 [Puccinia striiformis f. sp. tritici]KAH9451856.1 hypothetical protein Pst134EA_025796 [Puccinia striiformis f. sp. tritici]
MAKTTNSKRKCPNPIPESSSEDNSSPGIQVETAPVEESQQEISATPTSAATPTPAKASTASLPSQSAKDGSPSDSTSQAKKPRSDVWIHFKKQGNGANTKATCNYCKTAMNGQSVNGTLTLWRHLTRCHSYKTSSKQSVTETQWTEFSGIEVGVFSGGIKRPTREDGHRTQATIPICLVRPVSSFCSLAPSKIQAHWPHDPQIGHHGNVSKDEGTARKGASQCR